MSTQMKNGVPKKDSSVQVNNLNLQENNKNPSTTSKKKRNKKKSKKQKLQPALRNDLDMKASASSQVEVVYVNQTPIIDEEDPAYSEFAKIFERFNAKAEPKREEYVYSFNTTKKDVKTIDKEHKESAELQSDEDLAETQQLSNKKLRKLSRMTVAQLKQMVKKPEVVEWTDVTASDPVLLVSLKSTKNAVPVPRHWCNKRKYLQGKRGIQKPPFDLPDYIKETGIMEMRAVIKNRENSSTLAIKARERIHPKLGKMNIDYQRLHDAFFKFQTRPKLTGHGELYYEGKELEGRAREKKPGVLSEDLKSALNIPPLAPPPWLINMQRFGPPPSYPNLKISGLNAPIPEGAQWGYHPGGWGKPPVDEFNRPLYGDVFGTYYEEQDNVPHVEYDLWGEMNYDDIEEDIEQEGSEIPEAPEEIPEEIEEGMETPLNIPSIPSGSATPELVDLQKEPTKKHYSSDEEPKTLYKVIKEKESKITGFMGSQHKYEVEHRKKENVDKDEESEKKTKLRKDVSSKSSQKKKSDKKHKEFKF